MSNRPKAPGLKWRTRRSGHVPIWIASDPSYPIRTENLSRFADDPDALVTRCEQLQAAMLDWIARANEPPLLQFDGTFRSLFRVWQADPDSPFHALRPSTRRTYQTYIKALEVQVGARRIDRIDGRDVTRWFRGWAGVDDLRSPTAKLAAAQMRLAIVKAAVRFGVMCRHKGCADLAVVLGSLSFPAPKPRTSAPTAAQVTDLRQAARIAGRPGRALAYAIQFETTLRQWDVIGTWVDLSDPRPSAVHNQGRKWVGPTWAMVDHDLILRLTPDKTRDSSGARVAFDLRLCPMVIEEIAAIPPERRNGPLVLNEATGFPYRDRQFRDGWHSDATAAGWPRGMWNRDIRAGGNTEAQRAGARLEDRRKVIGHTAGSAVTAEVYDRDALEAHRRVARARLSQRGEQPRNEVRERAGNESENL